MKITISEDERQQAEIVCDLVFNSIDIIRAQYGDTITTNVGIHNALLHILAHSCIIAALSLDTTPSKLAHKVAKDIQDIIKAMLEEEEEEDQQQ